MYKFKFVFKHRGLDRDIVGPIRALCSNWDWKSELFGDRMIQSIQSDRRGRIYRTGEDDWDDDDVHRARMEAGRQEAREEAREEERRKAIAKGLKYAGKLKRVAEEGERVGKRQKADEFGSRRLAEGYDQHECKDESYEEFLGAMKSLRL